MSEWLLTGTIATERIQDSTAQQNFQWVDIGIEQDKYYTNHLLCNGWKIHHFEESEQRIPICD